MNFITQFFLPFGKVHTHGGTVELIKLRVMSDENIARRQTMLCEIIEKGITDKEKKHNLSRLGFLRIVS